MSLINFYKNKIKYRYLKPTENVCIIIKRVLIFLEWTIYNIFYFDKIMKQVTYEFNAE